MWALIDGADSFSNPEKHQAPDTWHKLEAGGLRSSWKSIEGFEGHHLFDSETRLLGRFFPPTREKAQDYA